MPEIVLATLNAKYIHPAFGLRYLLANMGELRPATALLEFDINTRAVDIAEAILARDPRIVGLGVYIWNASQTASLVGILKKIRPRLLVVLGGPEISFETESRSLAALADYVICGEADLAFAELCRSILSGRAPLDKILKPALPELGQIHLPYSLYTDHDLKHRVVYVEGSRGCPFSCEFCLSSVGAPVRQFPLEPFLESLGALLDRGATQLKFVDRTFNLSLRSSLAILDYLWKRYRPGLFFHFEVVPDRLPPELREALARFPQGATQLEAGVQTFNPQVAERISRRQDYDRMEENLRFLRAQTGAHIHADLIAGLPGEDLESFASGFDRLVALGPHEIQVGLLKRLKGTPIVRHDAEWEMTYSHEPPFEILQTKVLPFETVQKLKRFARFWDLVGNSGNFITSTPLLWRGEACTARPLSPFAAFLGFTEWAFAQFGRTDSIALPRLAEALYRYLVQQPGMDPANVAAHLWADWQGAGRREIPEFLRGFNLPLTRRDLRPGLIPKRQARHTAQKPGAACESSKQG